jgi:hypothetical protein
MGKTLLVCLKATKELFALKSVRLKDLRDPT